MNIKERKAIIAGNWKLNKRVAEIPAFAQELQANLPAERCCDVAVSYTHLDVYKRQERWTFESATF